MNDAEIVAGFIIMILLSVIIVPICVISYLNYIHPYIRIIYYKHLYKPGKKYFVKFKHTANNPYKDASYIDEYAVEIIDTKVNKETNKLWVRFKYISDKRYKIHSYSEENLFEENSYEFKKLFTNKTNKS